MVSKKRVKRKSLGLRNRRNTRSQTKSRRSKNRLGSKNKRRRSRNTKKRKGGAEATADITDIGNLKFCKNKTTREECGKCHTVNGKKITLCQYTKLKNLLNFFKTPATKGKVDIEKLRNFLEHLRELIPENKGNEGNDKKNVNDMFEQEITDEITELLSEDKLGDMDLCIPFNDELFYNLGSHTVENDGTYGFGETYLDSLGPDRVCSN